MSNLPVNPKQSSKIICTCKRCNKEFYVIPSLIKKGKGKFCSRNCYIDKMRSKETIEAIFWTHVIKTESCWIFDKVPGSNGRINIGLGKGKQIGAHRFSYELHFGKIFDRKLFVCHHCDNPICINPSHLFLGKSQDNISDMVKKGRNVKGEKQRSAILKEEQVKEIKKMLKDGIYYRDIAHDFSVSHHVIWDIKRGKTWKHVHVD